MKYLTEILVIAALVVLLLVGASPVHAQCWSESAEISACAPRDGGTFGRSVTISGDTFAVGEMHGETNSCPPSMLEASFVHVFDRDATGWTLARTLASPPHVCVLGPSSFGVSIGLSADTLVVGAPGVGACQEGAVFVYERDLGGPDNWGQAAVLLSSGQVPWAEFGQSVAISGDTIVVGARSATCAYVYERNHGGAGAWGETAELNVQGAVLFGAAVGIAGDTIVVGSPYAWMAPGEAHVYERDLGGLGAWGEARRLSASDGLPDDRFGQAVGIDGDTVVVGAEYGITSSGITGAAYVFERDAGGAGNWGECVKLVASDPSAGLFGYAVAIFASTVIVGAQYAPYPDGAAFVFARDLGGPGAWGELQRLQPLEGFSREEFAASVAVSGDTAVAGARFVDFGQWPQVRGLAFDPGARLLYGAYGYEESTLSLDPATGQGTALGAIGFEQVAGLAFDPGTGTLFATTTKGPDQLMMIDLGSGAGTLVGPIGFNNVQGLAFDPALNVLYGADRGSGQLITIDTATGAGAAVGYFDGGHDEVYGLAFDATSGTLYATDRASGELLSVDPSTGLATAVGGHGYYAVDSLAFDSLTSTLYGVALVTGELLTIDPTTGAGTAIQTLFVSRAGAAFVHEYRAPSSYCTAGTSAAGCTALISGAGIPSASQPTGFTLTTAGVEGGRDGLYFLGTTGRQARPWGNGTSYQCVEPPVRRAALMSGQGTSGQCDGSFAHDLNAHWSAHPAQNPGVATAVQAQLWYRDPASTSNQTTSLSDALEFCVAP